MISRRGQVAVYLVAVILAVAILIVMNVSVFLSVRSKNRAMNAGDAAALAVAKYQGELLNQIGALNIAHLKAALDGDEEECAEIMERQKRLCFIGPLEGIRIGNDAARKNDTDHDAGEGMAEILREHIIDIRNVFAKSPELYPESWDGAWIEYADNLETIVGVLGDDMVVGPDNIEFADSWTCFPLLSKLFYEAISGEDWCWFHFNGEWLFDRDHHNMPRPSFDDPHPISNSEVYSLHLEFRPLPPLDDVKMREIVKMLADCSEDELNSPRNLIGDASQEWAFFDGMWHRWSEIDPLGENAFPVVGMVKPEYDVRGCAAICRVETGFEDLLDGGGGIVSWTAAAKPFGLVEDLEGGVAPVTALGNLVTPAFTDAKLVPVDSVGGLDLATADYAWMKHVKKHLPAYLSRGPHLVGVNCFYCDQLRRWENPVFRARGKTWLKHNSNTCIRPSNGYGSGGTAHGH